MGQTIETAAKEKTNHRIPSHSWRSAARGGCAMPPFWQQHMQSIGLARRAAEEKEASV